MAHRRFVTGGSRSFQISLAALTIALIAVARADAAPALKAAVSRLSHDGQAYDVTLPLSGGTGIECRDVTNGATLVLTFTEPLTSADVAVSAGTATVGAVAVAGNTLTVPLTSVANAQAVTLSIQNINAPGGAAADLSLGVRFLMGDINADGVVDDADLSAAQKLAGQAVTGANFRADSNLNGSISSIDATRITARRGLTVSGGATANSLPTLASISPPGPLTAGRGVLSIPITIGDSESDPASLYVSVKSLNPRMIPDSSIMISGTGTRRMLTVAAPARNVAGDARLNVTVSDGLGSAAQTVTVALKAPSSMYASYLRPQSGVLSLGSGIVTLELASDELSATVNFSVSNLTAIATAKHIHGPAGAGQSGDLLLDLASATPNPDGSFTWTFAPAAGHSVAEIVQAIKSGQTYADVSNSGFGDPNGEVRGQLAVINGTTAAMFTPPPSAPGSISLGVPTDTDAARLLTQATFGPSEDSINKLKTTGINAWLEQQFNAPPTSLQAKLMERVADGDAIDDDAMFTEVWWNVALTAPDQLRQRVAFALSQIFVISQQDGDISTHTQMAASYYDLLARDAFGNYRKLLEDVTLHPGMGQYLDMRNSKKGSTSGSGTATIIANIPNENYPREIMQLFSIGLVKLQPDGMPILDQTGDAVATYDQTVISGIPNPTPTPGVPFTQNGWAAAFTGWNWHQTGTGGSPSVDYTQPMTPVPGNHEGGAKVLFDGLTIPPRTPVTVQTTQQDLADALNALYNHSSTGPFICTRLIQRLVTSNPSPGYVYRVSQVFANNGQGVRGDLKAVIKAILTDYEARSPAVVGLQGYGKLKEPLLRVSHTMRAMHVQSSSGNFRMRTTDGNLFETALRAPTVFNFYEPNYTLSNGSLGLAANGLVGPEFKITSESSTANYINFMNSGIGFPASTDPAPNNFGAGGGTFQDGDLTLDLATEEPIAANAANLIDRYNRLLMAGQMSTSPAGGMRQRIIDYINTMPSATTQNRIDRARSALYLVVTSPEFSAQK